MKAIDSIDEKRTMTSSSYLLDNAAVQAPSRFSALADLFDAGTITYLERCGMTRGWHCLEIGAGGGSIANWIADRVGKEGRVVATDIDPRFLSELRHPRVEVWRHNIVSDPLPEAAFDLVHARLVLIHLPERDEALRRMIRALKPGGWLLSEEYDSASIAPDPMLDSGEMLLKTHVAMSRLMESRGVDRRCGRRMLHRLRANGLRDTGAEGRILMWQAGGAGVSLLQANFEQLRDEMIQAGHITAEEFAEDIAQMEQSNFTMPSAILWSAWGRKP